MTIRQVSQVTALAIASLVILSSACAQNAVGYLEIQKDPEIKKHKGKKVSWVGKEAGEIVMKADGTEVRAFIWRDGKGELWITNVFYVDGITKETEAAKAAQREQGPQGDVVVSGTIKDIQKQAEINMPTFGRPARVVPTLGDVTIDIKPKSNP